MLSHGNGVTSVYSDPLFWFLPFIEPKGKASRHFKKILCAFKTYRCLQSILYNEIWCTICKNGQKQTKMCKNRPKWTKIRKKWAKMDFAHFIEYSLVKNIKFIEHSLDIGSNNYNDFICSMFLRCSFKDVFNWLKMLKEIFPYVQVNVVIYIWW